MRSGVRRHRTWTKLYADGMRARVGFSDNLGLYHFYVEKPRPDGHIDSVGGHDVTFSEARRSAQRVHAEIRKKKWKGI